MITRMILRLLAFAFLTGIAVNGAQADPFSLTGIWSLQSMAFVDEATGKATHDFGDHPTGYAVYAPGGFMSVVINAEGRQPVAMDAPNATEQRAKLFTTMTAHAGPYEFSNGKLVNHVQAAHDPRMVGHDLVRFIRVIDNNHVESTVPATDRGGGRRVKTVLTWQRVK